MNTTQLIATCGASALFLAACVLGIAQHKLANRETVENEQDATREVAAHGFQWNGICVEADFDADVPFALDTIEDRDEFIRRHIGPKSA